MGADVDMGGWGRTVRDGGGQGPERGGGVENHDPVIYKESFRRINQVMLPKHLLWTKKSILLLAVPFLVPEALTNILLAPRTLMHQNSLLVSVGIF